MKRLQQIPAVIALTVVLSSVAMAGTITGSRSAKVGTITGSKSGTITGSKTSDHSRKGTITGSRSEEEALLAKLASLIVSLAW
jgi:hypothetical protein